nr:MAG TPA: hypothetical protein [Caudoviricetes sp.]
MCRLDYLYALPYYHLIYSISKFVKNFSTQYLTYKWC